MRQIFLLLPLCLFALGDRPAKVPAVSPDSAGSTVAATEVLRPGAGRTELGDSQRADAPEQELIFDDGSADGSGVVSDGLLVVTRLTPLVYPVKVTAVRFLFVGFRDHPSPVGKEIRIVVFTDPEGKGRPPAGPRFLVDQRATIPATGEFVTFPVDGPEVASGDIYVGYQAPNPAGGVGFAADSNGPARERGFWSKDGGATFSGPLEFNDGTTLNPLMRARVRVSSPGGPRIEELAADDGTLETGLLRDGGLYVNRLTPSRYPAALKKLRFRFTSFVNQPSAIGKSVRLVVFRDPDGKGAPPARPAFDVDREFTIPATGDFVEIPVDGLTVLSGDLYVGYRAPNPHQGVGFALDTDGPQHGRSFRSTDGGASFSGPLEVTVDGVSKRANLMLRAVVEYESVPSAGGLRLIAERESLDLSDGGETERFQVVALAEPGWSNPVRLSVATDPPGLPVNAAVEPAEIQPGQDATVTLSNLGRCEEDSFRVVITAESGSSRERLEIPASVWRLLAEETLGPEGGTLSGEGASVEVPAGAFTSGARLRLLTGRPKTGMEEFQASELYQVDGLPEGFEGSLKVAVGGGSKNNLRFTSPAGSPIAISTVRKVEGGSQTASLTHMLPGSPAVAGMSAQVDAKKLKLGKKFTFWMLKGYYAAQTPSGRFLLYYPITFTEAAEKIGAWLERAADLIESERVGLMFTARADLPIGVTIQPFGSKDADKRGYCDGSALWFNTRYLGSPEALQAFRMTPGHELMHMVQALYGGNAPRLSSWWNKTYPWYWLDEAISTWFEPLAIREPSYIPTTVRPQGTGGESSDNYITFPLRGLASPPGNASDQEHGYGASMFLTSADAVDQRLIARLMRSRDPGASAIEALSNALGGLAKTADAWGTFGRQYFSGGLYSGQKFPSPSDLTPGPANTTDAFARGDLHRFRWLRAPELSLERFMVRFRDPAAVPDLTDEVVLGASIEEGYPDVDLHVIAWDASGSEYLGTTSGKEELVLSADARKLASARKSVLIGVVNKAASASFNSTRDITVKFGLASPKVSISPDFSRTTGVIGHEYTFTTRNRNIPPDATYFWSLGGVGKTGRTVKHAFSGAGDYQIQVNVRFGNVTLEDRVIFKIAPDTAVQKADVLFDVYRQLKTPVGTSRQKCNNYTITISNSRGEVVEAGESIARNGAYETRLPVANGYGYSVRYSYPTACVDSGVRTGRFDVKANITNYVAVETPPCETR